MTADPSGEMCRSPKRRNRTHRGALHTSADDSLRQRRVREPRLPEERAQDLASAVRSRRFTLVHLTEVKDRDQNGTAWIKIAPIDIVPYPRTRMR